MSLKFLERQSTWREMLRNSAAFAGTTLLTQLFPASLLSAGVPDPRQQAATASTDHLAAMRAQMGSALFNRNRWRKILRYFRAWGKCCGVERARWQHRGRHVSYAGPAEVERNARWAGQCTAEDGDRHALAFRPHGQ